MDQMNRIKLFCHEKIDWKWLRDVLPTISECIRGTGRRILQMWLRRLLPEVCGCYVTTECDVTGPAARVVALLGSVVERAAAKADGRTTEGFFLDVG